MYARVLGGVVVTSLALALVARAVTAPPLGAERELDPPALAGAIGDQTVAAAAWDGQGFLVAWRSSLWRPELRAGRVTATGEALDGRGLLLDGFERSDGSVAVAAGGGGGPPGWAEGAPA